MADFTVVDVERVVRKLAGEHPQRTADCQYVRGDPPRPLCIVAHALSELGVPLARLQKADVDSATAIDSLLIELGVIAERSRARWLVAVQEWQDVGASWAESIACADAHVERVAGI